jgi:germination protein M
MRHVIQPRRLLITLAALSLILAACGADGSGGTTTSGTEPSTTTVPPTTTTVALETTTTAPATTTVTTGATGHVVYFLLEDLDVEDGTPGPYLVPVHRESPMMGTEAETVVNILLEGPSGDEVAGTPAISTAIPDGTSLLGVTVESGLATVDLSDQYDDGGGSFGMFARLGQVVYTLTRLSGVEEVAFEIEGEPVTVFSSEGIELDRPQVRDDYFDTLLSPTFVDSPAWGEPVISPIEARGLSNVFEAVSQIMLTDDDGLTLFEAPVMATCGTGCWGEWEVDIPYTIDREQFGALIVWEDSAKDGSRVNIREYPIQLR